MNWIDKKIEELGGLSESEGQTNSDDIRDFFSRKGIDDQSVFYKLITELGGRNFNENVVVPNSGNIPVADKNNFIPFSVFLGFKNGGFGIIEINEMLSDNLPLDSVAFGMGDPTGDYWVCNTRNGKISFWIHDSEDPFIYPVADNLESFISGFLIDTSKRSDDNEIVDFWIADDF